MDSQTESFYRRIYADLKVDHQESQALGNYFRALNPPPDKLIWLRAAAFRIGCESLADDDKEHNVELLRAINAIVHALEQTCMEPKLPEGNSEFDEEAVSEYYSKLYADLVIDSEENADVKQYFDEHIPPSDSLVALRATAFKAAVDLLADEKSENIKLLRCINVIVHNFEQACLAPKEYELKLQPPDFDLDISLSECLQELWKLDVNRLTPDVDYKINVQGGKKPYWKEDSAPDPLFDHVDSSVWRRPTYRSFIALLDNYKSETGQAESESPREKQEIKDFLKAIMQTAPMQFCHKYCHAKDPKRVPSSISKFSDLLYDIWFDLYGRSRNGKLDSSGFEHVFVGEVKDDKVSGFHNWIQYYLEEKRGNVDYRGYIKPRDRSEANSDSNDHVLSIQFRWHGVEKFVGTSFIGVSPEFEMALYTTFFLLGEEEEDVELDTGTDVFGIKIRCYKMARDKIGTAFPEANSHYD